MPFSDLLNILRLTNSNATRIVKKNARMGNNRAINASATLAIFSPVATTGFATPNVNVELIPLVATVAVWMVADIPPPATMATAHCMIGSLPSREIAVIPIPATTAAGVARVSSRLSTRGT